MAGTALSTGVLTSNTSVFSGKNLVNGLIAGGDGTNVATITVYDNTSASGSIIMQVIVPAGQRQVLVFPMRSIQASLGLYVSVSGTGANAQLYYGV